MRVPVGGLFGFVVAGEAIPVGAGRGDLNIQYSIINLQGSMDRAGLLRLEGRCYGVLQIRYNGVVVNNQKGATTHEPRPT